MRKQIWKAMALFAACCFFVGNSALSAENPPSAPPAPAFALHGVYGDHMVLQRGRPIKISGTAAPGAAVQVEIAGTAGDPAAANATAGEDGRWLATLPELPAGGPYEVTVSGPEGAAPIVLRDVLVGEVWLASGQSNMEMPVFGARNFWNSANGKAEAEAADFPQIRLYNATAKKYVSPGKEQSEPVGAGWTVCAPDTAAPFSAVAFYFGRGLRRELDVPVGLISAAWGGTRIEPWISETGFRDAGRVVEIARIDALHKDDKEREARVAEIRERIRKASFAWEQRFRASDPQATKDAEGWKNPDLDDADWTVINRLPESFPTDSDGIAWYRKTVELPADWAGQALTLSLGPIDDCDETYFNGIKVGATGTDTDMYWSAKRVYAVPAEAVRAGRNVIAIRVADMFSTGGPQGLPSERFLVRQDKPDDKAMLGDEGWRLKVEFIVDPQKIGQRPDPSAYMGSDARNPSFPATLYNSMIAPWTIFPIRGALWYQGESNAGSAEDYFQLHQILVNDWRRAWNDPELAFLFVQLAGYETHRPADRLPDDFWVGRAPANPSWASLRESQAATLDVVPRTGMAVAIDCGDHSDIHPADKQTIADRLLKEALRICYGRDIVSAGPYFKSMEIKDGKAILSFDNVGRGLTAKDNAEGKLNGFAIAGPDGRFVWADAMIDGDTVVVSAAEINQPEAVRYAWLTYADNLNFYNLDGFPACPFRTDIPDYIANPPAEGAAAPAAPAAPETSAVFKGEAISEVAGERVAADKAEDAAPAPPILDGARLAIAGDSITEQKQYSRFIEVYLVASQPAKLDDIIQLGWSGDRAPGFARRMANDCLFFKPTVITTCFGMNDGSYRAYTDEIGNAYRDGMDSLMSQAKAAGAVVLAAGPGAVDTKRFTRIDSAVYNENLGRLSAIAKELAVQYGFPYTDVHQVCVDAMAKAKADLGDDYVVMGNDGVHPGPNGQLAMAYAFLKGMGLSGDIGAITVTLAPGGNSAVATDGHTAKVNAAGEVEVVSARWPFCFSGKPGEANTLAMARYLPFNADLNRFVLKVENLAAAKAEVAWGNAQKTFTAAELAAGVNLSEAFIGETPFQADWEKLNQAVQNKQNFETWLIKQFRNQMPSLLARAGDDPDFKAKLDDFWSELMALRAKQVEAVKRAFVPVAHTLRVTPVEE